MSSLALGRAPDHRRWHLQRAQVSLRRQGLNADQVHRAVVLYGQGWSCQRLGERFGCSAETMRQELRRPGVQLRAPWERGPP